MTRIGAYDPSIYQIDTRWGVSSRWEDIIERAAMQFGVPAELLNQMMLYESQGNPNAVGDGGASRGLMQIQQGAWEDFQRKYGDKLPPELRNASYEEIINNPELNMKAAAAMMKTFHDQWVDKGYSSDEAWKLALREYNSGSYAVDPSNLYSAGPGTPEYVDNIWGAYSRSPGFVVDSFSPADEWDIA